MTDTKPLQWLYNDTTNEVFTKNGDCHHTICQSVRTTDEAKQICAAVNGWTMERELLERCRLWIGVQGGEIQRKGWRETRNKMVADIEKFLDEASPS